MVLRSVADLRTPVRRQSEGGESSDEDEDDAPEDDADGSQDDDDDDDDDEDGSHSSGRDAGDWYDVDDGFIDDSELLDAAEERKAKHNGFFINKACIVLRTPPMRSRVLKTAARREISSASRERFASSLRALPRSARSSPRGYVFDAARLMLALPVSRLRSVR